MPKEDAIFFNQQNRTLAKHWLRIFSIGKCSEEQMDSKLPNNHKHSARYWWW